MLFLFPVQENPVFVFVLFFKTSLSSSQNLCLLPSMIPAIPQNEGARFPWSASRPSSQGNFRAAQQAEIGQSTINKDSECFEPHFPGPALPLPFPHLLLFKYTPGYSCESRKCLCQLARLSALPPPPHTHLICLVTVYPKDVMKVDRSDSRFICGRTGSSTVGWRWDGAGDRLEKPERQPAPLTM